MKKQIEIKDNSGWNEIKELGRDNYQIVIFKYSPICSISSSAENQFDKWFLKIPEDVNLCAAKVNVILSRNMSQTIAAELKVEHQSPQAIWLSHSGEVKWHASHFDISLMKLNELLVG